MSSPTPPARLVPSPAPLSLPRRPRSHHPAVQVLICLAVALLPSSGALAAWFVVWFQLFGETADRADHLGAAATLVAAVVLTLAVGPLVVSRFGFSPALHAVWVVTAVVTALVALSTASTGWATAPDPLDGSVSFAGSAFGAVVVPTTWPGLVLGWTALVMLLRDWCLRRRR